MEFENHGYDLDLYLSGKFIGSIKSEKDREVFGYDGRKKMTFDKDIVVRKKTYRAGTEFITELIPLCGRIKS